MQAVWQTEKSYEFMWRGSKSLPIPQSEILTHIINGNYGGAVLLQPNPLPPPGPPLLTASHLLCADLMGDLKFQWDYNKNPPVNATSLPILCVQQKPQPRITPITC